MIFAQNEHSASLIILLLSLFKDRRVSLFEHLVSLCQVWLKMAQWVWKL
jgi:hypothetical protein